MVIASRDLLERADVFPQLKLAIELALNAKEKNWGYFRVRRIDGVYHLDIPYMELLRVQNTSDKQGFKAFWGNAHKPTITTRKRRKVITDRKTNRDLVQRTYEVLYHSRSAFRQANYLIATTIRDQLRATLTAADENELEPLVLLLEQSGDR
ncbi:MAG: hypothetical protein EAZ61_11185 [Oscillatoriales cyanobacterium]|nr:MAG: hypothetical protein EAZ61_11185 [Oscillatoriales cyanobacterium]